MKAEITLLDKPVTLFVYGTLKKKYGNHVLIKDCEHLGNHTLKGYKLLSVMGYYPAMVESKEDSVVGECYVVTDKVTLERVRALEYSYNEENVKGLTYYTFDDLRVERHKKSLLDVEPNNDNVYEW